MAVRYTKEQIKGRNEAEVIRLVGLMNREFKTLLGHKDSGIEWESLSGQNNRFLISLAHPDLMDKTQRRGDLLDMISIAKKSDLVKKAKSAGEGIPTYTDLYNGLFLPWIAIEVTIG
jgi:hypothetical protein